MDLNDPADLQVPTGPMDQKDLTGRKDPTGLEGPTDLKYQTCPTIIKDPTALTDSRLPKSTSKKSRQFPSEATWQALYTATYAFRSPPPPARAAAQPDFSEKFLVRDHRPFLSPKHDRTTPPATILL